MRESYDVVIMLRNKKTKKISTYGAFEMDVDVKMDVDVTQITKTYEPIYEIYAKGKLKSEIGGKPPRWTKKQLIN